MNNRTFLFVFVCFSIAVLSIAACHRDNKASYQSFQGATMGTSWSVKLRMEAGHDADNLRQGMQQSLDLINTLMSNWEPDSDVSRFNQMQDAACMEVNPKTLEVVSASLSLSEKSQGAFDVTVGPLIRLWGFAQDLKLGSIPSASEIEAQLNRIGFAHLYVKDQQLCKRQRGMEINLSAIAKGYAVDQLADFLNQNNLQHYLVEVGGELYAKGLNTKGQAWRVGIETPLANQRSVYNNTIVPLDGLGMATSGDYRNFIEHQGKRYAHTISPETGYPVEHALASVTVVADSSMLADAWATALMVLGPDKGMALAEQEGLAVLMLLREGEGFVTKSNTRMEVLLSQQSY